MQALLDAFDCIYIINLVSRPDRRAEMRAQLQTIGLDYGQPQVHLFSAVKPDDAAGFPSIGARGCFLSHLGVLRAAVSAGHQRLLVLEDDCNFTADFVDRAPAVMAEVATSDWSFFYAGKRCEGLAPTRPGAHCGILPPDQAVYTAHWLGLRGDAIGELISELESILQRAPGDPKGGPMHVDGAYARFRHANPVYPTVLCLEPLAYQRASRTDIHALNWFDRLPVVAQLTSLLRKQRNG